MGSLMAGWDSPVLNSRTVTYKRNWSLTKEEIESYWRKKEEVEEDHLRALSNFVQSGENTELKRSNSLPLANTHQAFADNVETETASSKQHGWWASSSSAFLNEPPVLLLASEGPTYKYASQFHIANMAPSKPQGCSGID